MKNIPLNFRNFIQTFEKIMTNKHFLLLIFNNILDFLLKNMTTSQKFFEINLTFYISYSFCSIFHQFYTIFIRIFFSEMFYTTIFLWTIFTNSSLPSFYSLFIHFLYWYFLSSILNLFCGALCLQQVFFKVTTFSFSLYH